MTQGGTAASRSVVIMGKVVENAAIQMKSLLDKETATTFGGYDYPIKLEFDRVNVSGDAYPAHSISLNISFVLINKSTYEITVPAIFASYDVGTIINPLVVEGQVHGGVLQGLGYAIMENMVTSKGRFVQDNLSNYFVPMATDIPQIYYNTINNPYSNGPKGAKGLGELVLVAVAPSINNAAFKALNKEIHSLPINPEKLMEVIKK